MFDLGLCCIIAVWIDLKGTGRCGCRCGILGAAPGVGVAPTALGAVLEAVVLEGGVLMMLC